jgi:hypothetical protein
MAQAMQDKKSKESRENAFLNEQVPSGIRF